MPTLSDAIAAIKAGRRDEARVMLKRILATDGNNITALLWMTEVATTPDERRKYLRRILAIDPNNASARKGLELLDRADKPLPSTATQPLTRQPPSTNAAEGQMMSLDERKPQRAPIGTPAPIIVSAPKASRAIDQKALIIAVAGVICVIVAALVVSILISRSRTSQVSQTNPTEARKSLPATRPYPTPTLRHELWWPELPSLSSYPTVSGLDLLKRPSFYKDSPVCLVLMTVFNAQEDENGNTTFMIQETRSPYSVIGAVVYPGPMTGLVDGRIISIGGYVLGTESDLGISTSSRPVILMQQGVWSHPWSIDGHDYLDPASYYYVGDVDLKSHIFGCK